MHSQSGIEVDVNEMTHAWKMMEGFTINILRIGTSDVSSFNDIHQELK